MIINLILILAENSTPGVTDIIGAMLPNLPIFIAHVLSTIIIILFLSKLVYKPFKKLLSDRRKKINELLDDAASKQAVANKEKKDAIKILSQAKLDSKEILSQAKIEAEDLKLEIINSAKQEAHNLQKHAKQAIEMEKSQTQENIRKEVIDLAFIAAEKIMETNVNKTVNEKLIEEFLDNL